MRISLGYQVLLAVLLGMFFGIFFGPYTKVIRPVGDVYVMLLQMVALPYICFSLIHGLGSIPPATGKKLFLRGWPFWLTLWAMIFSIIYTVSWLIPTPMSAFIGNVSAQDSPFMKNLLNYLVPENPFYDIANNIVPAITVFGLIAGCALMHLPKKDPLLSILERSIETIEKIFKWLAILSPIGIFAHIAYTTGTVYFEELFALQFYVVGFIAIALFTVFCILPAILTSLTPLTYRQILEAFKFVCLLPFATALGGISFPFINLYMKKLGQEYAHGDPQFHATSQTVMPLCFSFGQIGNCFVLFFILFLSFYFRHPLVGSEKWLLGLIVLPVSLGSSGSSINAVSFLIEFLNFPDAAKELFIQTMAVTMNFQVLLNIASVLTFIILVLYAYYGLLEVKWKQLFLRISFAFILLFAVVAGVKQVVRLHDNYQDLYLNLTLKEAINNPVQAKFIPEGEMGTPRSLVERESEPLDNILKSGVLKVGYDPDNIPYAYFNRYNELVGFDIAYAYQLARDLDCTIEFVPIEREEMGFQLTHGDYDLGMSAIIMTEMRIREMDFTHPYTEEDDILVVPNKERSQFTHFKQVAANPNLRLGAIGGYIPVVRRHFPLAQLVKVKDILLDFQEHQIDAYLWSRIPGFVWCLSNPDYVVIDYGGILGKRYFAYSIPSGSYDWGSFLNNWLLLKEQSGFNSRMYHYWIEGQSLQTRPPRWSIIRNVLHWVD